MSPRRVLRALTASAVLAPALLSVSATPAAAAPVLRWRANVGNVVESSPVVADLDGNGVLDLTFGARDGKVYALQGSNGASVAGWPRQTTNPIDGPPSVADTDGDGRPEVFIGVGIAQSPMSGALYSFEHNGHERFRFSHGDNHESSLGVRSAPAIGDVNRDGVVDVSFTAMGQRKFSVNQGGALNGGWPFPTWDTSFSSPALADVNGDGQTDVIMGGDSSPCVPCGFHQGGLIRAIDGSGQLLWSFATDEIVHSSPAVGDITGDGVPEIVSGTGEYWYESGKNPQDSTKIIVLDLQGRLLWKWETGGLTIGSPALADLNGDGRLDVALATAGGPQPGRVMAFDGLSRAALPGFPRATGASEASGAAYGSVVTADLNGDGGQDVLVPTYDGVFAYNGKNGALLTHFQGDYEAVQSAPVVADVDGNGRLDVLFATANGSGGHAYRYELDGGTLGARSWPMFQKDARRTGSWTNPPMTQTLCPPNDAGGYWIAERNGAVYSFCGAGFHGSMGGTALNQPIVEVVGTKSGAGYWLVAADGGVFSFGDARFHGSTGHIRLNQPIVGMARTRTGDGYWMAASDGGIFAFGDAGFFGSTGNIRLNQPIVGMAPTPTGNGYWLVASDGGIFAFGDAGFFGSTGDIRLNQPIVGMAAAPGGGGYWMVASDGGIFAFNAPFYGSTGDIRLNQPIVGMAAAPGGGGYWMVASDGGIFAFNAPFYGSAATYRPSSAVVGMAVPKQ